MISRERYEAYRVAIEAGGQAVSQAVRWLYAKSASGEALLDFESAYRALCELYGKACAQAALEFYGDMRAQAGDLPAFEPESYTKPLDKAGAVVAQANTSQDAASVLSDYASRFARQQAVDTVTQNAMRDPAHPMCMRVAQPTACGYCRMLASLGGWYANEQTARNANLHEHCHCMVVVEFSGDPALEGYDHGIYTKQYEAARDALGGKTDRASVIARMDADAGRSHQSAEEQRRRAQKRAERAARKKA